MFLVPLRPGDLVLHVVDAGVDAGQLHLGSVVLLGQTVQFVLERVQLSVRFVERALLERQLLLEGGAFGGGEEGQGGKTTQAAESPRIPG